MTMGTNPEKTAPRAGGPRVARALYDGGAVQVADDVSHRTSWHEYDGHATPVTIRPARCFGDPGATAVIASSIAEWIRWQVPDATSLIGANRDSAIWAGLAAARLGLRFGEYQDPGRASTAPEPLGSPGDDVVVVHDIITTGSNVERAVAGLRKRSNLNVIGCIAIVHAGQRRAREAQHRVGLSFSALCGLEHLMREGGARELFGGDLAGDLGAFFSDPASHVWA